jgi:hypothetical protein
MKLPEELESLCIKAINQGKAIIIGGDPVAFTLEEMQLVGKYIHCSANWNAVTFKNVWLDGNKVKTIYGAVKPAELVGFVNRPNPGWVRAVWNMQGTKA